MVMIKSLRPLLLFTIIIFLASCYAKESKLQGGQESGNASLPRYKVAPVFFGKATFHYTFPASIEGEQNVEIRPKVDGFVQKIFVDEGATVHKGQPLFQLKNPQYEAAVRTAVSSVAIAEADLLTSEMDVEKVKLLVDKNIISKYELESKFYALVSRRASLASAHANLINAEVNLRYTYISSPSNGIIGAIPYKVGSLVTSASIDPLTTVYNTRNVYAYFSLNEKQLLWLSRNVKGATLQNKLAIIQDVSLVMADGWEYPLKGRITTATGLISTETGSANFRATFPNPQQLIRSGNSATIKIPVTLDSAILIPQAATFNLQGKKFVYKLIGKDSISNVAVEVDENTVGDLYIVKQGLKKDDQILIEGAGNINGRIRIKPIPVNKDRLYIGVSK
jgi:membrane fusion protein, multidrug efflux system